MYSSRLARVDGVVGSGVDAILMILRLMPSGWCWGWRHLDDVEVDAIWMMLRLPPSWWCWGWRHLDDGEVDAILIMVGLTPFWWFWGWRHLDDGEVDAILMIFLRLAYYLESKVKLSNLFFWRKFFRKWGRVKIVQFPVVQPIQFSILYVQNGWAGVRKKKGVDCLLMAAKRGLWSMKRVKGRPSKKNLKCLTERKAARSSLSNL